MHANTDANFWFIKKTSQMLVISAENTNDQYCNNVQKQVIKHSGTIGTKFQVVEHSAHFDILWGWTH